VSVPKNSLGKVVILPLIGSYIANVFWLETANTWPNWTKWVSNSST